MLVTAAEYGIDHAAFDGGVGTSPDVSWIPRAITAAEHPVDTTAFNDQIGVSIGVHRTDVSRIGATVKLLNGVVAEINMNRGAICGSQISAWGVTRHVTATEYGVDGVLLG